MVSGSAANNKLIKVTAATTSTLTIDPSTPAVMESAGASDTIIQPYITVAGGGAYPELWPDDNTGILYLDTPIAIQSATGNIRPRFDIYTNGTIAGTAVVKIAMPGVTKLPFAPSLTAFTANDP
jgi:hypothetical protein